MAYARKVSASQIALYQKCPFQWFAKYKLKVKEPPTAALIKGSLVHSTIEEFFKLKPKECKINLGNYKIGFQDYILDVFNKTLNEPRTVFGKKQPSYYKELTTLCEDDFAVAKEIVDAKTILKNYTYLYTMQFEQFAEAAGNFPQAYYMSRPKFNELDLSFDNFIGFADALIEKDGQKIIKDYKTSKLFRTGFSEEYEQQLKLYVWAYYNIFDEVVNYGCIDYLRYGRECMYKIDHETVISQMDELVDWFFVNTESDSIEDYPMNSKHQFCTNCESKNPNGWKTGGGCWYSKFCNQRISGEEIIFT